MKLVMTLQEKEAINTLLKKLKRPSLDDMDDTFSFIKQEQKDGLVDFEVTNSMFRKVVDTLNKCIDDIYNPVTMLSILPKVKKIRGIVTEIGNTSSATKTAMERLNSLHEELIIHPEEFKEWKIDSSLVVSLTITPHSCDVKVNHNILTLKIAKEVISELSIISTSIRLALNEKRRYISSNYAKKIDMNLRRIDEAIAHFNYQVKKLAVK